MSEFLRLRNENNAFRARIVAKDAEIANVRALLSAMVCLYEDTPECAVKEAAGRLPGPLVRAMAYLDQLSAGVRAVEIPVHLSVETALPVSEEARRGLEELWGTDRSDSATAHDDHDEHARQYAKLFLEVPPLEKSTDHDDDVTAVDGPRMGTLCSHCGQFIVRGSCDCAPA